MRILILGGSSLIGTALTDQLLKEHEVEYTFFRNKINFEGARGHRLDLADVDGLLKLVSEVKPEVVIHTIAPPSVEWHETNRQEAYKINVLSMQALSKKTKELGSKLVYISTTFVFPKFNRIFTETDIPSPVNFYGVCKLGGELAAAFNPNNLIFRTDQIYGWALDSQRQSFVLDTIKKLKNLQKIQVFEDWYTMPTYVKDLSDSVVKGIEMDKKGIYHAVGDSYVNRMELATVIAKIFDLDETLITPISSSSAPSLAERPNCHASNEKLKKELHIKMKNIEDGLQAMKVEKLK